MKKFYNFLSKAAWVLAICMPVIFSLQGCTPVECFATLLNLVVPCILLIIFECLFSKCHEMVHMQVAKHYHPECEYKITNNHFSCNNPKVFKLSEIRIVAISANIINLAIAIPIALPAAILLGVEGAVSILVFSLFNLVMSSDNKTTTDGYLLAFPEKFYEVGGFN